MNLRSPSRRRLAAAGGIILSATLAVGLSASPAYAEAEVLGADHPDAVPGSYIVVLEDGAARGDSGSQASNLAGRYAGQVEFVYDAALTGFSARMSETAARRLAADPAVAYVEQDRMVSVEDTQFDPPSWGLDRIDQRTPMYNSQYRYRNEGSDVNIYIVDTGVRLTHDDFGGRAFTGYDAVTSGGSATDCNGHGTHVAGTAAGSSYGVAKQARIYSVRVFNCRGQGSMSQIVSGVDWVTSHAARPAVVNMSLSGSGWGSGAVDDAVNNSIDSGIVYVVAAGNDDSDACDVTPARVNRAITVAATNGDDDRAWFSNRGSCVDMFAPGVSIVSAVHSSDTAMALKSGTSMAAPHVTGAAAIVMSANPDWSEGMVRGRLFTDATLNKVGDTAGSPNRLLFAGTANTRPYVTRLRCESGNNQFVCQMSHHVWSGSASISWRLNGTTVPGWDGQVSVFGNCTSSTVVQAVATNSVGSHSRSWSKCRSGPWL